MKVKEASRGAVSVFTVKLEDLELHEWVIVINEYFSFFLNLLADDQMRWEVPDNLRTISSCPVGRQIRESLLRGQTLLKRILLLLLESSKCWTERIEMGNRLGEEVVLVSKVLVGGS